MKIELELKDAKKDIPENGLYVIIFRGNVDNRGVTKSIVGFYDADEKKWRGVNNAEVENVIHFAYLPEPRKDFEIITLPVR